MRRALLCSSLLVAVACSQAPVVDAGGDSGAEDDASTDAGADASADAGNDSGISDGGTDAGADASVDAGFDAGSNVGRPDAGGCWLPDGVGAPFRLRVVAANLTSGNQQTYQPEGQRILQGLAPDVVLLQEFRVGSSSSWELDAFVAATFDAGVDAGYSWSRGSGGIPNGVVSRWPIVAQGEWVDPYVSDRTFAWAYVDLPGPRNLYVVSVHLLTTGAGDRSLEATALAAQLLAWAPRADFLLVGGDLNTASRSEGALSDLSPHVVTTGPYPVDQQGDSTTNAPRNRPYDWVLASRCLDRLEVPVAIGSARFDAGLVVDTRVYAPIVDLAPALSTDSAASLMQHMAVVRDFLVQP